MKYSDSKKKKRNVPCFLYIIFLRIYVYTVKYLQQIVQTFESFYRKRLHSRNLTLTTYNDKIGSIALYNIVKYPLILKNCQMAGQNIAEF